MGWSLAYEYSKKGIALHIVERWKYLHYPLHPRCCPGRRACTMHMSMVYLESILHGV